MNIWGQREQAEKSIEKMEHIHSSLENLWSELCDELSEPVEKQMSSTQYSLAKSIDILKQIENKLIKEIMEKEENETVRI